MKGLVDVHVHLLALPTPANGCLMSRRMLRSPLARLVAWREGIPLDDPEAANRRYVELLDRELAASEAVSRAVVLAMDGAYDEGGRLDESRTDLLVANDCVLEAAAGRQRLLPGVSINPSRRDAVEELERCAERGAVLVKALPNAQIFDPAEPRFKPFYRRLGEMGMPLLSHVGHEFSLKGADQSLGDPGRLVPALEQGVTVIAAHGCSSGLFFPERHFGTMLDLVSRYKNFFVDTSALTLPSRVGALFRLRRHPEVFDRLLFGTDYPLPCFSYPSLWSASLRRYRRALSATNRFDRQLRVLESLGIRVGADFDTLSGSA
ncbi:MAG: amidohydrolase family protein [Elusimicrobiota bacterium]